MKKSCINTDKMILLSIDIQYYYIIASNVVQCPDGAVVYKVVQFKISQRIKLLDYFEFVIM